MTQDDLINEIVTFVSDFAAETGQVLKLRALSQKYNKRWRRVRPDVPLINALKGDPRVIVRCDYKTAAYTIQCVKHAESVAEQKRHLAQLLGE